MVSYHFQTSLPVLVRAAVLFECALYVNRIRNSWLPPSLEVNCDCKNVLINFKHWGEAVGSKLEELEELEQEKVKEEEPVLPKETSKGNSFMHYIFPVLIWLLVFRLP